MSLFVDDAPFELEQKYSVIYHKKTKKPIGICLEPEDAEGEHIINLQCFAKGRDWDKYQTIAEACTVLGRDNERLLRTTLLYPEIIMNFFVTWNVVKGKEAKPLEINRETIGKMHHSMVKALAKKWLRMTGGSVYGKEV